MSIKEEFQKIVDLQEIDLKIFNFAKEKDSEIPISLNNLEEKVKTKKEELLSLEESFKKIQLRKKDREIELDSREDSLRKSQAQLYQLKTNKEYQAKLKEIGAIKADISVTEEEVLKALEDIEEGKSDLEEKKSVLSKEESILKEEQAKLKDRIKDIDAQMNELKSKRDRFTNEINKQILAKYENLLITRGGLAVVAVKKSSCDSCHMKLTHQTINEIKMYKELICCGNCVRILYIPEDLQL